MCATCWSGSRATGGVRVHAAQIVRKEHDGSVLVTEVDATAQAVGPSDSPDIDSLIT